MYRQTAASHAEQAVAEGDDAEKYGKAEYKQQRERQGRRAEEWWNKTLIFGVLDDKSGPLRAGQEGDDEGAGEIPSLYRQEFDKGVAQKQPW